MPASLLDLHDFWFAGHTGWPEAQQAKQWFIGGERFDSQLRQRFGDLLERALTGVFDVADLEDRQAVACVIALDQLPRNVYRGKAQAFAGDELALQATRHLLDGGRYDGLDVAEQMFVLMPLEHAEEIAAQDESVARFEALCAAAPANMEEGTQGILDYAQRHREIIERFGRFPYRNQALGRETTPEEKQWLEQSDVSFGQKPA